MGRDGRHRRIAIRSVRLDGDTQIRAAINQLVVDEYADSMKMGAVFPPVVVFFDGEDYWLADGFHRVRAAKQARKKLIACELREGTARDARLFAAGSNAEHGLRRTNDDKRNAVMMLLADERWSRWSNREIARRCRVDEKLVRRLRRELSAAKPQIDNGNRAVRRGNSSYSMRTQAIGATARISKRARKLLAHTAVLEDQREALRIAALDKQTQVAIAQRIASDETVTVQRALREITADVNARAARRAKPKPGSAIRATLHLGDSERVLPDLRTHSAHALVTDPPAAIGFMDLDFDSDRGGRDQWIEWLARILVECRRVLLPGAHGLIWAFPRTAHWTMTAIEDAGYEIRDVITHHTSQGMPKSLDVSDAAKRWNGFGSALKPATESWILARVPLSEPSITANVLKHGVGAINIAACRVPSDDVSVIVRRTRPRYFPAGARDQSVGSLVGGRYPPNAIFSHAPGCGDSGCVAGCPVRAIENQMQGASEYFPILYEPKAAASERIEAGATRLPTLKSIGLMRWLTRLVTPPAGTVLDCFAGSGSTGVACAQEGFDFVGIEQEREYFEVAKARLRTAGARVTIGAKRKRRA